MRRIALDSRAILSRKWELNENRRQGALMSMAWADRRVPVPPLEQLEAIEVACDPCGRGKRIGEEALMGLCEKGFTVVDELRGRLRCTACGERLRLSLIPVFRRRAFQARAA